MSDFDTVLERLVTDRAFSRRMATDPRTALAGYSLSDDERHRLLVGVVPDGRPHSTVEQRTSKAGLVGLLGEAAGLIETAGGPARVADTTPTVREADAAASPDGRLHTITTPVPSGGSGGGAIGPAVPTGPAIQSGPLQIDFTGPDTDHDGLPDAAEKAAGSDPYRPDTDLDGMVDGLEHHIGTDPTQADTDGDGYDDYAEVVAGTDPTDQRDHPTGPVPHHWMGASAADNDGDGLTNAWELEHHTNPADPDTDGDLVDDGYEAAHGTDPTVADPLPGLDPFAVANAMANSAYAQQQAFEEFGTAVVGGTDTDGDGIGDQGELIWFHTNPGVADTDHDGLSDKYEVDHWLNPTEPDYDADNDGLSNAAELAGATDPLNADTDGDGRTDGQEQQDGTDPLDPDTDDDMLTDDQEHALGTDPLRYDTDYDGVGDGAEAMYGGDPTDGPPPELVADPMMPSPIHGPAPTLVPSTETPGRTGRG